MNDSDKFTEIYRDFTRSLLENYNNGKGNVVLSPFSIFVLLCIASDSTASETRDEIIKAICKDLSYEEVREIVRDLCEGFSKDDALSLANALCVNETIADSIKPEFKEMLSGDYGAEIFASKDIVNDVNKWVKEKTRGMIEKLANENMKNMLACLMNAICFEAEWAEPYEDEDIYEDEEFANADGSKAEVTMLVSKEECYIENDLFTGFIKPYKESGYSFMALLPKSESAEDLKNSISSLDFTQLYIRSQDLIVNVIMPEFRYDFSEELTDYLETLGINKIFSTSADFSPMTGEWLKADGIIHKAHIELDRNGTKAAAATAMFMVEGFAPSFEEIKYVKLDRPFIYAIMHTETKLPVFAGIVNKL